MMYVRFPLSLRQVEDLLHERDIDICHETVRTWWNRFGPMFAAGIRRRRSTSMRARMQWRWHLDGLNLGLQGADELLLMAISRHGVGQK
jgi:putative transposase